MIDEPKPARPSAEPVAQSQQANAVDVAAVAPLRSSTAVDFERAIAIVRARENWRGGDADTFMAMLRGNE